MSDLGKPGAPWADYMDARLRLIHEWRRDGIPGRKGRTATAEDIRDELNRHDTGQIVLLLHTDPAEPVAGSTRAQLLRLDCAFELIALSKRYERGDVDHAEMLAEVAAIIGRMP